MPLRVAGGFGHDGKIHKRPKLNANTCWRAPPTLICTARAYDDEGPHGAIEGIVPRISNNGDDGGDNGDDDDGGDVDGNAEGDTNMMVMAMLTA
eukprot:15461855-Alexandrium_andersonii.AAC.1